VTELPLLPYHLAPTGRWQRSKFYALFPISCCVLIPISRCLFHSRFGVGPGKVRAAKGCVLRRLCKGNYGGICV
jgi:hypothetical protein